MLRFSLFLCCFVLIGCSHQEFALDQLVGSWESTEGDNSRFEVWENNGISALKGEGYVLSRNDTVFIEHLEIRKIDGKLTYLARVPNSKKEGAVPFIAVNCEKSQITFENKSYLFPQRIVYILADDGSLQIIIQGLDDGVFKEIAFGFKK